jgi:hypothetical protein
MPASESQSSGSPSTDFTRPFDQAHQQAKSLFTTQKRTARYSGADQRALARPRKVRGRVYHHKLVSARSVPDVTSVYQDWFGQCMQRCVEDSNHVFADIQKLMRTGTRLVQNGKGSS